MRILLLLLFLLLSVPAPANAYISVLGQPTGAETITVSSTSLGIAQCVPGEMALIQVKTQTIYWNVMGITATSSHYLGSVGDYIAVPIPSRFRAIRATGSDASLYVTCFK